MYENSDCLILYNSVFIMFSLNGTEAEMIAFNMTTAVFPGSQQQPTQT